MKYHGRNTTEKRKLVNISILDTFVRDRKTLTYFFDIIHCFNFTFLTHFFSKCD